MPTTKRVVKIGAILGIAGGLLFLSIIFADQLIGPKINTAEEFLRVTSEGKYPAINMGSHFGLALAMMFMLIAFLGLKRLLDLERKSLAVTVATIFGIIACAIVVEMSIVQGTTMVKMGQLFASAAGQVQKETAVMLYRGLRYIDYGLDLAFDAFFFSAWIIFGSVMLRSKYFGKIQGGIGILLFAGAGVLNLWSAPDPPSIEIAPIAAVWVATVYIRMLIAAGRLPEGSDSV